MPQQKNSIFFVALVFTLRKGDGVEHNALRTYEVHSASHDEALGNALRASQDDITIKDHHLAMWRTHKYEAESAILAKSKKNGS